MTFSRFRLSCWTAIVTLASTLTLPNLQAQSAGVASDPSIFAPLTLPPAPSATRLANGAPGPKYWQNRADYDLQAVLDTVTKTVQGSMVMRYTNNSPNTLDVIWMQTEQNRLRPDSGAASDPSNPPYGDVIEQFTQLVKGKSVPVQLEDHKAETKVTLASPLRPGATATFIVKWHFLVPPPERRLGRRMGRRESLYEIAQWYPRVNVYDDVKGWNTEPYLGDSEFFLDYGNYTLSVTLPSNYIVAATGTLDNPSDVLTPAEIARRNTAAHADSIVHIVTAQELSDGSAHLKHDGMVTWKFTAKNVRDAVWCTAPDYQWDATSWKGILAQSYYEPSTASVWEDGADQARMSIQEYSERWFPYPYPQVSVVEGPVGGMEYPMLSMDGAADTKEGLYGVITHEVGHNWFPMIVGSNERVHTWMDEGFNTFINTFSDARRYPQNGNQEQRATPAIRWIGQQMASGQDAPLETGEVIGNAGGQYEKTGGVLEILYRDVMGPEAFDKGFKMYIQRWAYKHPTPMDFFRTMDNAAGHKLDWFWREWFLEAPRFDQAIDSVNVTTEGGSAKVTVVYGNHAGGVMPILARFTFSDGTTQDVKEPVDVWRANGTRYVKSYTFAGKSVKQIALDPDKHFIDADRTNNSWTAK